MTLTYKGNATFTDDVKIHLLILSLSLRAKGEKVTLGWIFTIMFFAVINSLVLWPLALIWAANHFGASLSYTFETFIAGYLFYYLLTKKD